MIAVEKGDMLYCRCIFGTRSAVKGRAAKEPVLSFGWHPKAGEERDPVHAKSADAFDRLDQ